MTAPEPAFPTVNAALRAAAASPNALTFLDGQERETTLTWAKVLERAAATAAGLVARGVKRGDRVAIVIPTSPAFVDSFFGVMLVGAVPVPLYPPVRLGRL